MPFVKFIIKIIIVAHQYIKFIIVLFYFPTFF